MSNTNEQKINTSNTSDKISIIVPVYNASKYLKECIESLIGQTYKNLEIILVDDGSKDDSYVICKKFAESDSRIILLKQENQGVSVARNNALNIATGNWITFVDSDDFAHPNMCELVLSVAKKQNAQIVLWSYISHFNDKQSENKFISGKSRDITKEKDYLELKTISQYYERVATNSSISAGCTWGKLYEATLIKVNNIRFKAGLVRSQDTIFSLEAFELSSKIYFYDECLYHYRRTNTAVTSGTKFIEDSRKPFDMLIESYVSFINRYNKGQEFETALNLRIIQILLWHFKHNYFNSQNNDKIKVKLKKVKQLIRDEKYQKAIRNVHLKYLGRKLKLTVILLRARMVFLAYILYKLILED